MRTKFGDSYASTTAVALLKFGGPRPSAADQHLSHELIDQFVGAYLNGLSRRIPPPGWSRFDWAQELAQVGAIAAWQAEEAFDPARGTPLGGFVQSRVAARCLSRRRDEWRYGSHCIAAAPPAGTGTSENPDDPPPDEPTDSLGGADDAGEDPYFEELRLAIARLPAKLGEAIQLVYFQEKTQDEAAGILHISQRAVSKRNQAAIAELRRALPPRACVAVAAPTLSPET